MLIDRPNRHTCISVHPPLRESHARNARLVLEAGVVEEAATFSHHHRRAAHFLRVLMIKDRAVLPDCRVQQRVILRRCEAGGRAVVVHHEGLVRQNKLLRRAGEGRRGGACCVVLLAVFPFLEHPAEHPVLLQSAIRKQSYIAPPGQADDDGFAAGTYLWWRMRRLEAELVHDPAGLDAVGGSPLVEHERLPHADDGARGRASHLAVLARGLPVPGLGGAVRARSRRVLAVPEAEEVPLARRQLGSVCERRSRRKKLQRVS
jgi:hypothetical protein